MHDEKDLEIIRLSYRVAALELQNTRLEAQFDTGRRITAQILNERCELAQTLRTKHRLLLMPRASLEPIFAFASPE